ncbi:MULTISPECIES: MlaD family protein [unclassified Lentimonas]|uniref:MlaD family protein n=1 Tax=unclassified Lentimonas TaxID=2630993 RepID=UPI001389B681|nr:MULTISPECIES: MlaD family protein [unclassified Lentimonas]
MSRKTNPKIIGVFVTASIALMVVLVLFFGSFSLFGQTTRYVLFFDQSVNGLSVGSTVKYRGVPVGAVERILIRVEGQKEHSTSIPVIIRIDRSRLTNDLGTSVETFGPKTIHGMIDRGLVAQLNIESMITGQLFVEFSMQRDVRNIFVEHRDNDYGMVEIPTLGSSLHELGNELGTVISALAEFDYEGLEANLNHMLVELSQTLEGLDTAGMSKSFVKAADGVNALLESGELEETLLATRSALAQVESTLESYDLEEGPLAEAITQWTTAFEQTLTGFDELVADGSALLEPDSSMRVELEGAIRELGRAAQSMRFLVEYIERNPNALITGRESSK